MGGPGLHPNGAASHLHAEASKTARTLILKDNDSSAYAVAHESVNNPNSEVCITERKRRVGPSRTWLRIQLVSLCKLHNSTSLLSLLMGRNIDIYLLELSGVWWVKNCIFTNQGSWFMAYKHIYGWDSDD